jgi:hypothetical protein
LDVPFAGQVAAPGIFAYGPVQQISGFLYDELLAALENNHRELIDPISYFPQKIATEAARAGASSIAYPMLRLYPAMYYLAKTR